MLYYSLRLITGRRIAERWIYHVVSNWAKCVVLSTFTTVTVFGYENLSAETNVCFICNHQSFFDITVLLGWLRKPVGFVAKKELRTIPILNGWITAIHSVFIDRQNSRKAITSINKAIELIKLGHCIAIFPEGTRSKDGKIGEFKIGSLKLATASQSIIQPITITGTWDIYEKNHAITKSRVLMTIHKMITPEDYNALDKKSLIDNLRNIINSGDYQNHKKLDL